MPERKEQLKIAQKKFRKNPENKRLDLIIKKEDYHLISDNAAKNCMTIKDYIVYCIKKDNIENSEINKIRSNLSLDLKYEKLDKADLIVLVKDLIARIQKQKFWIERLEKTKKILMDK